MGVLDDRSVHVVEWLLLVSWVFAGIYLSRRVTRTVVAAAMFCGVAVLMIQTVLTAYADVPSALFASLAILALGLWLDEGNRGDLVIATVLFIGAANVKNEGAVGTAVALVAAAAILFFTRERGRLRQLALAAGAILAIGVLPWRIWLAANSIHGDHSFGKSIDISFLFDHRSRVWPAVKALVTQIQPTSFEPRLFVPIGLAITLVALGSRSRRRPLSAYYLAVGLLYFIGLLWGYWTSPFTGSLYDGQVFTTVVRITIGLGLIGLVAVVHIGEARRAQAGAETDTAAPERGQERSVSARA
jgi:4-amino-4-deoxy-L-arabinose transferase-like glycosyltransferase